MKEFYAVSDTIESLDSGEASESVVSENASFAPLENIATEPRLAKFTLGTVLWAFLATVIASIIVGGLWHGIAYYFFEIPIIMPIFAGVGAGYLVGYALKLVRIQKTSIAVWIGLAAALLTVFSRHAWDAYTTRPAMIAYLEERVHKRYPDMSLAAIHARTESVLTPLNTLRWHMEMSADYGIVFRGSHRGMPTGRGVRLNGGWFWGLLALNTVAAAIAGAATTESMSLKRYCAECNKPLKENLLFRRHSDQVEEVLVQARRQDWHGLMSIPKAERVDLKNLTDVILHRCEAGGCPATLSIETQIAPKPRERRLHAWISPESANAARAASIAEPL